MELPVGYAFRAPTQGDLDAVAAVFKADDLDDAGETVLDAAFLRTMWNHPGFEPATDAWIVVDGSETIVGYAHAMLEGSDVVESLGVVHPAHRGRGVGSWLLDRIEQRAGRLLAGSSAPRFRHAINAGDDAAVAMLRARQLQPIRSFWHMGIDLGGAVEPGRVLPGIEISTVDPREDLPVVHAILADAFADDWGYHPEPFEQWAAAYAEDPSYDPTLWLLARDGSVPVGALAAGDRGWIGEVGVVTTQRGRGIGGALLERSFATFARRGLRRVMLNVDAENPTGATALYESVGMRVVKRWDLWERSGALA